MSDETDPLRNLRPNMTPVAELPEAVQAALMELVAETIRRHTPLMNWNVPDVHFQGFPMGSYRITIEKVG